MPFATTILTANTALPQSSPAETVDAFCYSGPAHTLCQQQGPCSVLLVMYSA